MNDLHKNRETREHWEEGYLHTRRNVRLRRWRMRRLVDAPKDRLLVELGCGDGLNLQVAKDLGFQKIFGTDYSFDLLKGLRNFPVFAGDGHQLPITSDRVPTLFVDSVLHHLTDYPAAAFELARVLEPGGRLYYFEPRPGLPRQLLDWLTLASWTRWIPFFASRKQTILGEWELYQHWLAHHEEILDSLLQAGLRLRWKKNGPLGMFLSLEKPTNASQA